MTTGKLKSYEFVKPSGMHIMVNENSAPHALELGWLPVKDYEAAKAPAPDAPKAPKPKAAEPKVPAAKTGKAKAAVPAAAKAK